MMKFKEILKRITGISTPIFGVSWNPDNTERDVARQAITFLEDRRVLYHPTEMEVPAHCVSSVLEIRRFLTSEISLAPDGSEISKSLRAMRAASRKFLDTVRYSEKAPFGSTVIRFGDHQDRLDGWIFNSAIGELRGVFGQQVARVAAAYGLDVETGLASILPLSDD